MIRQIGKLVVQMAAGANVATVIVMLAVGFSDHLSPVDHPMMAPLGILFPVFLLLNLCFLLFWIIFKWRMIWIPIVGYLFAYVPISIYIPLNPPQDVPNDAIKLISYNVCGYGGNYKYTDAFERICTYLREEKVDIFCTQEENDTWRRYTFQEYQKIWAYNDTVVFAISPLGINAVGIHTRFPIIKRERIEYPSEGNGSVAWYLKVGQDTLLVINNHFELTHLSKEDRSMYKEMLQGELKRDTARQESKKLLLTLSQSAVLRAPQVEAVRRYAEEHSHYPTIICGDFNDSPISYAHYRFREGMTDCFAKTSRGIGLSYNQKGFYVRIDHLFCSENIQPYNCKIDNKIDFSDHYPLVCWLKIGAKP